MRHHSAVLTSAMASAAHATHHAPAVAVRGGGAPASGGGGSDSSSSARISAVMRSVWVSMPATSARRSSAKCSRSVLSVRGLDGTAAPGSVGTPSTRALNGVKLACAGLRRSGTRCNSYSTLDTSVGLICLGSTPTAPSARA